MRFIESTAEEMAVLAELPDECFRLSEMLPEERAFLNTLLLERKPKNILEVGVAAGSSSIVILNAIKGVSGARLHSIDLHAGYYRDPSKRSGFLVDDFPELRALHSFHGGGHVCDFIDAIAADMNGGKAGLTENCGCIDFCFLDAAHAMPGEILDFLMLLPYLREGCLVAIHDTHFHTISYHGEYCANRLLSSALSGERILLPRQADPFANLQHGYVTNNLSPFPNIEAMEINKKAIVDDLFGLFALLSLKWKNIYSSTDLARILEHLTRFYDNRIIEYVKTALVLQMQNLNRVALAQEEMRRQRPLYIYGAGRAGQRFVRLAKKLELPIDIRGFLDRNPLLHGKEMCGLTVYSPEFPKNNGEAPLVLVAIESVPVKWAVINVCQRMGYAIVDNNSFTEGLLREYIDGMIGLDVLAGSLSG